MRKSLRSILFFSAIALAACSKGGNDTTPDKPAPAAASLVSPANNSACLTGSAAADYKQVVSLKWNAASGAESYTLTIKNLLNSQTYTSTVTTNNSEITLPANQPYSWYVVSRAAATSKTAQSETWKFFLAGSPEPGYAPFPATAVAPENNSVIASGGAATVSITLKWTGDDIDNDIDTYAVYLDDKDGSTKIETAITGNQLSRSLAYRKTYYWKVITTDKAGNESSSPVFKFIVN